MKRRKSVSGAPSVAARARRGVAGTIVLLAVAACGAEGGSGAAAAPGASAQAASAASSAEQEHPGQPPAYEDHPAGKVAGVVKPAAVDLASHPRARQFRTVLSRGAAEGPNFAGHYTVVAWGCGTMCQEMMVVDARTGRIVAEMRAPLGFQFRLGSRLLIVNPPEAVRESPCPACQTQYHFWSEEEARLHRIPDEAWRGAAPPPQAYRELVARMRAEEEPPLLQRYAPAVVRPAWSRLVITARDGSRHTFADDVAGDDLRSIHRFGGYLEGLDAYVLVRQYVPEGRQVLLVDARTGRATQVDAPPVPSPDGKRFVTASLDLVAGHEPNRIRIYRVEAAGPVVEWETEPREWGARHASWVDGRTIRLERGVVDWNTHELRTSPMLLRQEGGQWTVQASRDHARDALLAFFAALGKGLYIEAVQFYGGSYEVLRGWNPDLDPKDLTGLWSAACERNGLQCLGRAEVVGSETVSPTETRFTLRFLTDRGEPFVLGPCCGATAEEMPPRHEFPFTVRRVGERYLVQDLPVYVP